MVFHCAGEVSNELGMRQLHVNGTQYLLNAVMEEARKRKKTIHWVQLSSVGVYGKPKGKANTQRTVTEQTSVHPKGEYEITKAISDALVIKASASGLITYSILRPSNVFGADMPNQSLKVLGRMVNNKMFFYIGSSGAIATYIHVDDVVKALLLCATSENAKNMVFNVSNDCLLEDMINGMARALSTPVPKLRVPEFFIRFTVKLLSVFTSFPLTNSRIDALVARTHYSNDLIEEKLNFSTQMGIPQTIREVIES